MNRQQKSQVGKLWNEKGLWKGCWWCWFVHWSLQMKFVMLSPKLEYLPLYGAEQITYSEGAREWVDLAFRHQSQLIRGISNQFQQRNTYPLQYGPTACTMLQCAAKGMLSFLNLCMLSARINAHTEEIMMMERLDIEKLVTPRSAFK